VPAPEPKNKNNEEGKDAKDSKEDKPQPRGTIVKIGTAEFSILDRTK
jgi:hypothetical protein